MREIQVVGGVLVEDGRVLIVRRPHHDTGGGLWEFPGGKIEEGENPSQALAREIDEELGLRVRVGQDLGLLSHRYPQVLIHMRLFLMTRLSGEIELREHDAYEWTAPELLEEERLLLADRPFVSRIRAALGK